MCWDNKMLHLTPDQIEDVRDSRRQILFRAFQIIILARDIISLILASTFFLKDSECLTYSITGAVIAFIVLASISSINALFNAVVGEAAINNSFVNKCISLTM